MFPPTYISCDSAVLPSCPLLACVTPGISRRTHPEGEPCNKVKSCFFRPAGRFRAGLVRPISAPLCSSDGESTGDPPAASLALTLAPWPAKRAAKVDQIESVSRATPPAPRCLAGYVKPALRYGHSKKKLPVDPKQFSYER